MSNRFFGLMIAMATVVAVLALAPVPVAGQAPPPRKASARLRPPHPTHYGVASPKLQRRRASLDVARQSEVGQATAAKTWDPPRTPDGQPNIQGSWGQRDNITTYSLQAGVEDRAEHIGITGQAAATGHPIKDPPDKIPYQPWAAAKAKLHYEEHWRPSKPEYLDPVVRGFLEGVPRINLQGGFQIIQPPGQVVLVHDYSHTYRVIPLDGRPHLGKDVKLWMGDSRGHWEGNTLVVDVTNNNDQTWFDIVGSFHSDALHMVERWTFVSPDKIEYDVTIDDPEVFTRPWKMAWTYGRNQGEEPWESAVWEGNRAAEVIFGGGQR